jgi:DAK2 domain fusion protein YloV
VILSLIFRGFAKSVKGLPFISGKDLAEGLLRGSEAAYKAVMKPTEGTILTVVREAAQRAREIALKTDDALDVWRAALQRACETLAKTPQLLPALRQAGVVDAGGQGLVYIMEGLLSGFTGHAEVPVIAESFSYAPSESVAMASSAAAKSNVDIKFTYCTEFLVERTSDAQKNDSTELRVALAELGDCVVVVDDDDILKVHVHSNQPGDVLNLAQAYGQFVQMKVENMRKQHTNAIAGAPEPVGDVVPAEKKFGIVAVAAGEGMAELFRSVGTDEVVSGGQSMNPSTEELLRAVNQTPAEHVFLLPNNKNIIMAAEQVEALTARGVSVVQTRSVPEGVAAVLEFDESAGVEANHVQMQRAAERVQTGLITYAARESNAEGLDIKQGAVIGLENGKLTVTETEPVSAAYRVARHLVRKHSGSMITLYAGEDVTQAQTDQLVDMLEKRYNGSVEISTVQGSQPMYYYMIAVE